MGTQCKEDMDCRTKIINDAAISKWDGEYVYNPYNLDRHDVRWYEMSANRSAARYFRDHYDEMKL